MANWTITGGGYSADILADEGIESTRIMLENGLADSATFNVAVDFDAYTELARLDDLTISYNGAVVFRGYVENVEPHATGREEGVRVTCTGYGMRLARTPFTQLVATDAGTGRIGFGELGWDDDGEPLNVAGILADIITSTASMHGVTAGTILTGHDVTVPPMEVVDLSCHGALLRALRWVPDAVVWCNHATGAVNITQPSTMSTTTIASTGSGVEFVEPEARRRQEVKGVVIDWLVTTTVDGVETQQVFSDTAGVTTGMDVARVTIPLSGGDFHVQRQQVFTAPLPRSGNDFSESEWAEWLATYDPRFKGWNWEESPDAFRVTRCQQTVDTERKTGLGSVPLFADLPAYPRMIRNGAVPEWQAGISAAPVVVEIKVTVGEGFEDVPSVQKVFNGHSGVLELTLTHRVTGTDAVTKTYEQVVQVSGGVTPAAGIADSWWAALNGEAPAFTIGLVSEEPRLDLKPGGKLALSGDFAQAASPIQRVVIDVDAGKTTVHCGPQSKLTPMDLAELMRAGSRSGSPVRNASGARRTSAALSGKEIKGTAGSATSDTTATPPVRKVSHGVTLTGKDRVKVAAGWTIILKRNSSDNVNPLTAYVSAGETTLTGLVDGDVIWLRLDFDLDPASISYAVTDGDGGVDTFERTYGNFVATIVKGGGASLPATTYYAVRLATYKLATSGDEEDKPELIIHHEGDIHVTLPPYQIDPPEA